MIANRYNLLRSNQLITKLKLNQVKLRVNKLYLNNHLKKSYILPSYYSTVISSIPKSLISKVKSNAIQSPLASFNLINLKLSPKEIEDLTSNLINQVKVSLDEISLLPPKDCNFDNVFKKLDEIDNWLTTMGSSCSFPMYVSGDSDIRAEALNSYNRLSQFKVECSLREDIYRAIVNARENINSYEGKCNLDEEDVRLMDKIEEEYKKLGFHLPDDKRNRLKSILVEINQLSSQFSTNIAIDQTHLELKYDDLEGLSNEFISSLKTKDDENGNKIYLVKMTYPEVNPILESAKKEDTRSKLDLIYNSRCPQNLELLKKTLELRAEVAQLLGFKNYAEYRLKGRMANQPEIVNLFLDELISKFQPLLKHEIDDLVSLKKEDIPNTEEIKSYDIAYYKEKLIQKTCQIDLQKVQKYFPAEHVIDTSFDLLAKVFNIEFQKLDKTQFQAWHDNVECIIVKDAVDKKTLGAFYMDLFPRDNKFTHAACFPLQPSKDDQLPQCALVCNFTPPQSHINQPSLLTHYEMVTFLHEMGHVLHCILSKPKYSRFAGPNVEHDFVEAPSQLMENWAWDKHFLKKVSKHYKTGEKLDDKIIEGIIKMKNVCAALFWTRQLVFGKFDMMLHSNNTSFTSPTSLFHKLRHSITQIPAQSTTHTETTFNHIMGGYDVGYYGYLWALVYSYDIFESLIKHNGGLTFRKEILELGGARDANKMLENALGRKPNSDAFWKALIGN